MNQKSGTFPLTTENLQKILNYSKLLLKTETQLTASGQSGDEALKWTVSQELIDGMNLLKLKIF